MAYDPSLLDTFAEHSGLFVDLVESCRNHYVISPSAFSNNYIKRGLREADGTGVIAGITRKGNVHGYIVSEGERIPAPGELFYCGYNVEDLVNSFMSEGRFGFEETAFLLLFGHLPSEEELDSFDRIMDACRFLPPRFTEDIIMKAPSTSVMNKMATGVLALYAYDDNPDDSSLENIMRQSIELIARLPIIAAHSYAVYRNVFRGKSLTLHNPRNNLCTAENFLRVLRSDKSYTDEEAKLLDLCLVLHAEHGGGNNSTFSTRVISSTGSDTYSAIASAICSLKGPRHGGANIKAQQMFDDAKANILNPKDDGEVKDYLVKILRGEAGDGSGLIYGMGHAVYTLSDPRAVTLKRYARSLAEKKGYGADFELLETIERLSPGVFHEERRIEKPLCANVDLYSGLVYRMLGIPTEMFTPLFAIARVAGWCAHRIEEAAQSKIIRPGYKCIAKETRYVPLAERS
ncbi:MAG: citrate synthase [Clostridia bacterium]|nr:citrate synthase [Clostridia bacterium]